MGALQEMFKRKAGAKEGLEHRGSSTQMDPIWEEYMRTNERINPNQGLETPLLDPLDPFLIPKTLPVKAAKAYAKLMAEAVARGVESGHPAMAAMSPLNIIKGKGGNWLTGSVENVLSGLKTNAHLFPDAKPGQLALDNWIEGPLTKYVKRDMATEGDPVRKLAEQGVLHVDPEQLNFRQEMHGKHLGHGQSAVAINPVAKSWEGAADNSVFSNRPKDLSNDTFTRNPWLRNLNPDDSVYQADKMISPDLGFNHLTDELSNALNPESGLPRHLQLTPEQMQQMGMEKAVRHVADINAWRAAQQAEANLAKSQSPAVHMVREYAENNPKGLRWVEIKQPKETKLVEGEYSDPRFDIPEAAQDNINNKAHREVRRLGLDDESDDYMYAVQDRIQELSMEYAAKNKPMVSQELADQLKYEGDMMGHCVGGYYNNVADGKYRIFSLRDAKGEPHVTIETAPDRRTVWDLKQDGDTELGPMSIVQIKGKQNRKPNNEYLPFVQDFVKNHPEGGQWGDIGDIQNTGLRSSRDVWNTMEQSKIREAGKEFGDYLTPEDIEAINSAVWPKQSYAEGGIVQGTYQPVEFDGVTGYILR